MLALANDKTHDLNWLSRMFCFYFNFYWQT